MPLLTTINPIALQLGPIAIHWYGVMYVLGFLFCSLYFSKYFLKRFSSPFTVNDLPDIMTHVFFGIIFGGRLGYVLFYNFSYFIANPLHIPAVWEGGLSFHGGLLGVIIALSWYCKKKNYHPLSFADTIILPIPIAIGLGRLGNFINGELWGKVSPTNTWCMYFDHVDDACRYPSQLWEACGEGVFIFFCLHYFLYCTKFKEHRGRLFGSFLILYSIIRWSIEYIREPDQQIGLLWNTLSMGQLLSLPLFIAGIFIFFHHAYTNRSTHH